VARVAAHDVVNERAWYIVLTVTPRAADAINVIVSSSPVPQGGLKISGAPEGDSQAAFQLSVVEGPAGTDSIVEEQGSRVFLEDSVAPQLDNAVLDAQVEGDQVRFSLQEQPPA
jgi:iron-sulfur cluster assembly protein